MRLSSAQLAVLRLGATLCLVAVVPLALVAILVGSGPAATVTTVDDPTSFALPDPGLFGGSATVYGHADRPSVSPRDLGCVLLNRKGDEANQAKLSELAVLLGEPSPVTVDGQTLQPLFEVKNYPSGATIECSAAAGAEPLAVSEPSTFGGAALAVRITAAAGALLCLVLGGVGWWVLRPRRS